MYSRVRKQGGQVFILDRILWRVKNEDLTPMSYKQCIYKDAYVYVENGEVTSWQDR